MPAGRLVWLLAATAWLCFVVIGVCCDVIRSRILVPRLGARRARAVSTLVLCVLLLCTISLFVGATGVRAPRPLLRIGVFWTVPTAAAGPLLGRYAEGRSWADLRADYDIRTGRLGILVLVATLLGPVLVGGMLR